MIYPFFLYKILSCNDVKFTQQSTFKSYLLSYLGFYEASCVSVSKTWTHQFNTRVRTVPYLQSSFGYTFKLWSSLLYLRITYHPTGIH